MTRQNAHSFGGRKEAQMEKINGIIVDGKVYVADPEYSHCKDCTIGGFCNKIEVKYGFPMCTILGATASNDFGFRYFPELTEKLNGK